MYYTRMSLLFMIAFIQWAFHCDGAFPRSNRGDPGGGVIVQLFRWRFDDIARECEQFLGPTGYGGVEVAPITEHWVDSTREPKWDEPYYPVSYKIYSRSGDEKSFIEMVQRCNKAGVKVYVAVVMAYMASSTEPLHGYGGSTADGGKYNYPAVPYVAEDFDQCSITNIYNITQIRSCDSKSDHHLNHTRPNVRMALRNFLNKLISFGVAGFSTDSANRIQPDHLRAIFNRLRYLNSSHGFACESEPYIYQEYDSVYGENDEAAKEYYALGRLADYNYRYEINAAFTGYQYISRLGESIRSRKTLLPDDRALVFIDSQSAQKKYSPYKISFSTSDQYIPATAFILAYPFGQPRIASNYKYKVWDDAPPLKDGAIAAVKFDGENCTGDWICEHRLPAIKNMIEFRNVVGDANVTHFWQDRYENLAFSRGDKGFVLFNGMYWYYSAYMNSVQTGLPKGEYCDVITGTLKDNNCTGKTITVDDDGYMQFYSSEDQVGVHAIHVEAKLK